MLDGRFWSKVERTDGCWWWRGAISDGYGRYRYEGVSQYAHRLAYEALMGPIPRGLELDHLCRNTACINPAHLEAVTHAENMLRGRSHWRELTHCAKGHAFDAHNGRQRVCRTCANERNRAYKQRRRLKVAV